MKKLILIAAIGLVTLSSALSQDNNTNSTPTTGLVLMTNTVTTVRVTPLKLTSEQMDGIIQLVQGAGIQANGLITSTNLQNINVIRLPDNTFTVQVNLRPIRN
jgi:hypothetical protein